MVFPHLLRFPLVKMVLLPRSSHEVFFEIFKIFLWNFVLLSLNRIFANQISIVAIESIVTIEPIETIENLNPKPESYGRRQAKKL